MKMNTKNFGVAALLVVLLTGVVLISGCVKQEPVSAPGKETETVSEISTPNYTQTHIANTSVNETKPEGTFSITGCKAVMYFGYEDWAAGLNCSYTTDIPCSDIFDPDEVVEITLYGPTKKKIGIVTVCGSGEKIIRMAPEWITPDSGTYTLVAEKSGKKLDEYSITFSGQGLAMIPSLTGPALKYSNIFKKYVTVSDFESCSVEFEMKNSGDLPVFTDSVHAKVDGESVSISLKYTGLEPGATISGSCLCTRGIGIEGGMHTLIVTTYNGENKISEDMLNFLIPSLEIVK